MQGLNLLGVGPWVPVLAPPPPTTPPTFGRKLLYVPINQVAKTGANPRNQLAINLCQC